MFDIGWSELLVIGIVALIVIGPKELPGVLRTLGQWMGKIRRMASEFQGQFQEAMREAEIAELKKEIDEMAAKATTTASSIRWRTCAATSRRRRNCRRSTSRQAGDRDAADAAGDRRDRRGRNAGDGCRAAGCRSRSRVRASADAAQPGRAA